MIVLKEVSFKDAIQPFSDAFFQSYGKNWNELRPDEKKAYLALVDPLTTLGGCHFTDTEDGFYDIVAKLEDAYSYLIRFEDENAKKHAEDLRLVDLSLRGLVVYVSAIWQKTIKPLPPQEGHC